MSTETVTKLGQPLTSKDVELRIGSTSAKGFSLLLYKTARTDIKRLNETCGIGWSNKHFYDDKDNLCCEISIYDDENKQWISRVDVGIESFTEKEKGSYSDSFKRAGFRWGIGLELYQSPFIWIMWDMEKKQDNKGYNPVKFYPSNLNITKYEVVDGIPKLTIKYQSKVIYSDFGAKVDDPETSSKIMTADQQRDLVEAVNFLPKEESGKLEDWLKSPRSKDDAEKMLKRVNQIIDQNA